MERLFHPLVGGSARLAAGYAILASVLAGGLAVSIRWTAPEHPVVILLGLVVFLVSLIAAGWQATSNGGLLPSVLLGCSLPVGIAVGLSGFSRSSPIPAEWLLFGLFFGMGFYVLGIETAQRYGAEPRRRRRLERFLTIVFLAILALLFAWSGLWRLFVPFSL